MLHVAVEARAVLITVTVNAILNLCIGFAVAVEALLALMRIAGLNLYFWLLWLLKLFVVVETLVTLMILTVTAVPFL